MSADGAIHGFAELQSMSGHSVLFQEFTNFRGRMHFPSDQADLVSRLVVKIAAGKPRRGMNRKDGGHGGVDGVPGTGSGCFGSQAKAD
jgi:hypothetical protein